MWSVEGWGIIIPILSIFIIDAFHIISVCTHFGMYVQGEAGCGEAGVLIPSHMDEKSSRNQRRDGDSAVYIR